MCTIPRIQRGFTLIELMIVIAIVSILVTLAVPAYRDYLVRSKVTECVNNASTVKLVISEFRQSATPTNWPPTADAAGAAPPSGSSRHCIAFINYASASGVFEIDVNEISVGATVSPVQPRLMPSDNGSGTVSWLCTRGVTDPAAVKYLPAPCRAANS
jgi:type IV pilus assembly protein PilA